MPIKLPDLAEYRLPRALGQFAPTLQRIIDVEHLLNLHHADYHAYLTVDQGVVEPDQLQREAPCHVDGFQGARWHPRCFTNHSYTVSDVLPTAYYVQPFDLTPLDETKHDFFWELNAQVADTNEAHRWQPEAAELTVMDCYCVHRGVEARAHAANLLRLRRSRNGAACSIVSATRTIRYCLYAWPMVERDIEQLHLRAFRDDCDPSHAVFPWQALDGLAAARRAQDQYLGCALATGAHERLGELPQAQDRRQAVRPSLNTSVLPNEMFSAACQATNARTPVEPSSAFSLFSYSPWTFATIASPSDSSRAFDRIGLAPSIIGSCTRGSPPGCS